jgi:hypothetical protein
VLPETLFIRHDSTDPRAATCIQMPTPLWGLRESSDILGDFHIEVAPIIVNLKPLNEAGGAPMSQVTTSLVTVSPALEV